MEMRRRRSEVDAYDADIDAEHDHIYDAMRRLNDIEEQESIREHIQVSAYDRCSRMILSQSENGKFLLITTIGIGVIIGIVCMALQ